MVVSFYRVAGFDRLFLRDGCTEHERSSHWRLTSSRWFSSSQNGEIKSKSISHRDGEVWLPNVFEYLDHSFLHSVDETTLVRLKQACPPASSKILPSQADLSGKSITTMRQDENVKKKSGDGTLETNLFVESFLSPPSLLEKHDKPSLPSGTSKTTKIV